MKPKVSHKFRSSARLITVMAAFAVSAGLLTGGCPSPDIQDAVEQYFFDRPAPAGPQGDPGEAGDTGDKGDTGQDGADGQKGDEGDKGDPGDDGADGLNGDKGDKGDPGDDATLTGGDGILVDQGEVSLDTGFTDERYWALGGNDVAATAVLGTLTDYPLELIVNGARALRIEPNDTCPNLIGGHSDNFVSGGVGGATIGGGGGSDDASNSVTGHFGTVGGGYYNSAYAFAAVAGGTINHASGEKSFIGGGSHNNASGTYSTIAGGSGNEASGRYSSVCGGDDNTASGYGSMVLGGVYCVSSGYYSLAAGLQAHAEHDGSFVWGDRYGAVVASSTENEWTVRARGGVRFFTNSDLTTGVILPPGGSAWQSVSDRSAKANFKAVNVTEVLDRLAGIPIETWNYKTQDPSIRHMGPMAQDFYAAFGVGEDDRHITTIDADGVALAAIQGLYNVVRERDELISSQQEQIDRLEARLSVLEALVGTR